MKKYFYLLLIGSMTFLQCNTKTIKNYAVVIKPIGPEDVPRTTFYISLKKTNFKKENSFTDEIITDENSLRNVVSFIEDHRPIVKDTINEAGWGSLEISIYDKIQVIMDYRLNRGDYSKNYLSLLIVSLQQNNSDRQLIKVLKEKGLAQIP